MHSIFYHDIAAVIEIQKQKPIITQEVAVFLMDDCQCFFHTRDVFKVLNMPRKSVMPADEAVTVLKRYISYFITESLPEWSSDVWKKIADEEEIKKYGWTIHSVKTIVREDRRNILTRAREECSYFVNKNVKDESDDNSGDSDDDSCCEDDDENDKDYVNKLYKHENPGLEIFDVVVDKSLWQRITMHIEDKEKNYADVKLRPKVWTHLLACEFWKQYKLKCAFVFKKGEIHENGGYYATMHGKCKSKKCSNPLFGYIVNNPEKEGPVTVHFQCRDTRHNQHEEVQRPLQGEFRDAVRREVKEKGVKGTRMKEANDLLLQPGDTQCPLLFSSNVLYQLNKESVEKEFNVKPEDRRDLIKAIINISDDPIYRDCIINLGDIPFMVFYLTPSQLHCYKEYRRICTKDSSICIDATGGLVRKFMDSKGIKTSNIFLYQIVVNFKNTTVPVYQMLSELHDSSTIGFWLNRWLRLGNLLPKEVVCDGARALLNAACMEFNKFSLSEYLKKCFQNAKTNTISKSIKTYIRLDTAHFLHTVSTWKLWNFVLHKHIKTFYLYCVGLLIDAKDFKTLEQIATLIFIVCNVEFEDSVVDFKFRNEYITSLKARQILENLISTKDITTFINEMEENVNKINASFDPEKENSLRDEKIIVEDVHEISSWLVELGKPSLSIITNGSTLNCFYLPKFCPLLKEKLQQFALWSKVCIKHSNLRPTSSYVEESFKDLKIILPKQISLPSRVDIFIKAHLRMLIGGVKLFQLKLSKFIEEIVSIQEDEFDKNLVANDDDKKPLNESDKNLVDNDDDKKFINESDEEPLDESSYENWKGLGNDPKHKKFNWINSDDFNDDENKDASIQNYSAPVNEITKNKISNSNDNSEIEFEKANVQECCATTISSNNSINEDHCYSIKSPLVETHENKVESVVTSITRQIKKEGKYFQACPDINLINDGVVKKLREMNKDNSKKGKKKNVSKRNKKKLSRNLLENGNSSGPLTFEGISWFTYNTCSFDSIAQILYSGALEDQEFLNFLLNSQNQTFLFVVDFLSKGITLESFGKIYQSRFQILHPIYKYREITQTNCENEDKNDNGKSLSRVIDCQDNVNSLWNRLFHEQPSVFEDYLCLTPACKNHRRNLPVINVNYQTLYDHGFQSLENSIIFKGVSQNLFCKKCETKNLICTRTLNVYVYIELEMPETFNKKSKEAKLRDFPKHIILSEENLLGEIKQLRYRLCGYANKHYIAYCQGLSGTWQFFNDLLSAPHAITSSTSINPHGVLYILCHSST